MMIKRYYLTGHLMSLLLSLGEDIKLSEYFINCAIINAFVDVNLAYRILRSSIPNCHRSYS